MSDEDAFLDGIAADRADRTRLLVFADWLADHDDPREEFVRLHAQLLEMNGTEEEFRERNGLWKTWVGGTPFDRPAPSRLSQRWLDALCRVYTTADTAADRFDRYAPSETTTRFEYGPTDHADRNGGYTTVLYHGKPRAFDGPFDFVVQTVLQDLPHDYESDGDGTPSHIHLTPVTRGGFWNGWRAALAALVARPRIPVPAADNYFLGAQYVASDPEFVGIVAIHRHDYFALVWAVEA